MIWRMFVHALKHIYNEYINKKYRVKVCKTLQFLRLHTDIQDEKNKCGWILMLQGDFDLEK